MKFDKVIMNPPYDIGGKIWDKARKVSENIVCLMPLAQYKKNERYRYIDSFEILDNTLFDAIISGNLCITTCQSMDNYIFGQNIYTVTEYVNILFKG